MSGNNPGYIYILTNPSIQDMVKIGFTNRSVNIRAKELSSATGVPTPFKIYSSFKVPKGMSNIIERQIHKELSKYRVNQNREFFKLPPEQAKKKVVMHFKKYKRATKLPKFIFFLSIIAISLSYLFSNEIMMYSERFVSAIS